MDRTKTIFISAALLAVPLLALLAAAPASAHACTAQDPKASCGECRSSLTSPYHDHNYNNGNNYCNSLGAILDDVTASADVGVILALP